MTGHLRTDRQSPSHAGRRTCVGCRRRDDRSALLRVVARAAQEPDTATVAVVPDVEERRPGRGAWIHPTADCFEQAVRRRAFGRALRVSAPLDLSAVRGEVGSTQ
ncbi:YlxR family protein [Luteipulveratus flavus]|uniref:YlxR family protein n=1 Tax=Luteipulveratus flavus TaxID=3031728 RepID=A0ABT6C2W7_9MICO|nr:YlxR family protein [Luteipulveratus sp. YIM 133296]MDF8263299.1 YlxR family protein [Luteipulveratus sp. YIM 133296]